MIKVHKYNSMWIGNLIPIKDLFLHAENSDARVGYFKKQLLYVC